MMRLAPLPRVKNKLKLEPSMELKFRFDEAAVGPAAFTRICASKKTTIKNDRIDRNFFLKTFHHRKDRCFLQEGGWRRTVAGCRDKERRSKRDFSTLNTRKCKTRSTT